MSETVSTALSAGVEIQHSAERARAAELLADLKRRLVRHTIEELVQLAAENKLVSQEVAARPLEDWTYDEVFMLDVVAIRYMSCVKSTDITIDLDGIPLRCQLYSVVD